VRFVEWSGVSGVDSPGSVPGPPQRQRSQQCASCHHCLLVVNMVLPNKIKLQ